MNRNLAAKNKPSYKVYGFWSIILLLTLVFIGFVIYRYVDTRSGLSMDDLSNLSGQQIFEQGGTYYIYVYSNAGITEEKSELDRHEDLKETIENYLSKANKNKEAPKLYGMVVDDGYYANYGSLVTGTQGTDNRGRTSFRDIKINRADVPMLIKISDGRISSEFLKEIDIRAELESVPGGN